MYRPRTKQGRPPHLVSRACGHARPVGPPRGRGVARELYVLNVAADDTGLDGRPEIPPERSWRRKEPGTCRRAPRTHPSDRDRRARPRYRLRALPRWVERSKRCWDRDQLCQEARLAEHRDQVLSRFAREPEDAVRPVAADWPLSGCKSSAEILNLMGYAPAGRGPSLYVKFPPTKENSQGLRFALNQPQDTQWKDAPGADRERSHVAAGQLCAAVSGEKHAETFWVEAASHYRRRKRIFPLPANHPYPPARDRPA